MPDLIGHILGVGAVLEVVDGVVLAVAVQVARFQPRRQRAEKSLAGEPVHHAVEYLPLSGQNYFEALVGTYHGLLKDAAPGPLSGHTPDAAEVADLVVAFKIWYG
jgi:hypothetical protein